jgi:hypothetical protein
LCSCDFNAFDAIVAKPEIETDEIGRTFLILPISKEKLRFGEQYKEYLPYITNDLLRDAEEKINSECGDNQNSGFYFGIDQEGYLILQKEVIVSIPEDQRNWGSGCYDHKHKFYQERISTKAIEENIDG